MQQAAKKYLTILPVNIALSADSGLINLKIDSNVNWQLHEELEWINLGKYIGSNSDTINVTYNSNKKIIPREGIITITGANIIRDVIIYQRALDAYLSIVPNFKVVNADSGKFTLNVESNAPWKVNNSINWLNISPDSGEGNSIITISYKANTDSLSRIAKLSFGAENFTNKFVLDQRGLDVFDIIAYTDSINSGTTSGGGRYLFGIQAKIIAFPNQGWIFKNWKENNLIVSTDSIYTFVVSSSRTLFAQFEKILTEVTDENKLAENYELFQNYPNPFNPETHIKFSVPEGSIVLLNVYNGFGEKVRGLMAQFLEPGVYNIPFDGKDLASGIYFYRMQALNFVQVKKMQLVK